jgi:hypothetical protein
MFNGRRQPSCDGTSRMTRECQVRICERLGVKFPGPTRQQRRSPNSGAKTDMPARRIRAPLPDFERPKVPLSSVGEVCHRMRRPRTTRNRPVRSALPAYESRRR